MRALLVLAPAVLLATAVGAQAAPGGSYRNSCSNIRTDGPILNATCKGSNGRMFDTTIDTRQCRGQGVANSFGRLVCGNVQGSATQLRGRGNDDDDDDQGYGQRRQGGYGGNGGYGYNGNSRRGYGYGDPDDYQQGYRPQPPRPRYYDPDQDD